MDKFADKKIDRKKSPFYNLNDTKNIGIRTDEKGEE